ncbi:hypothetical protein AB0I61_20985 [Polymorphospora rubra]|uniref:hypothetical protein n=1 Tax=Polymorphospora rubra TaxID=338584 RepID=UPI0033FF1E93
MTLCAALVLGLAAPARAADPVAYDEPGTHDALFAAAVGVRSTGTAGLVDTVVAAELLDWRGRNPAASRPEIQQHLTATTTAVTQAVRTDDESPAKLLQLAAAMARLADTDGAYLGGPTVGAVLRSTTGEELAGIVPPIEQVRTGTQEHVWDILFRGAHTQVWRTFHRHGAADADLAAVWNGAYGNRLGVVLGATATELAALPELAGHLDLAAITAKRGDKEAYETVVRAQLDAVLAALKARAETTVTAVVAASDRFPVDGPNKPTSTDEAAAKAAAEANKKALEGLGQAVSVLSFLAGLVDKPFGKQIETIGKAVVGAVSAISTYVTTISAATMTAASLALASITLVGGLVGAAMLLLPLFTGSGGADSAVSQQIAQLRDQVTRLAAGLDKRFDRIEKMLGAMYDGLTAQLTALARENVEVKAQLTVIAGQLLVLDQRVDALALASQAAFEEVAQKPLKTTIDRYVHRETRGVPAIGSYDVYFDEADSPTRTFAVDDARRAPYVVPVGAPLTDPVATVDLHLPSGSIDYLARWAGQRGIALTPAPGDQPAAEVANPAAWLLGARANLIIALQNPTYAGQLAATETETTIAAGDAVNRRVRQFSAPAADGDTNALFKTLLADYTSALAGWSTALAEVGRAVRWVETDRDYDMWGSPDQAVPAGGRVADVATMPYCENTGRAVSTPTNVNRSTLPNAFHLGNYAMPPGHRPELRSCLEASYENLRTTTGPRFEITSGTLKLVARQQAKWVGGQWRDVRTVTWRTGLSEICSWTVRDPIPTGYCHEPDHFVTKNWTSTYRSKLETAGTVVDDPGVLEEARVKVRAMLTGKQKYFYRVAALGTGTERPPAGSWSPSQQLWDAGHKVTDAVRMLQIFSELGWASALERDDLMNAQLFGDRALPADFGLPRSQNSHDPGSQYLRNAFHRAVANYAPCQQYLDWDPCQGDLTGHDPRYNQERFGPECALSTAAGRPIDPLGSCVFQAAQAGAATLAERYRDWSGRVKGGTHREGLPAVTTVVDLLRATNEHVHTATN